MEEFNSERWDKLKSICLDYLKAFCDKHDYDFDDAKDSWLGVFNGFLVFCGDECVSMEEIIIDIETDAPKDEFINWYTYCANAYNAGVKYPNYISWLNGCPRYRDKELKFFAKKNRHDQGTISDIVEYNDNIENLKEDFKTMIDEYKKDEG